MTDRSLGSVFADPEVAQAYRQRAPYAKETFDILEHLLVDPPTILDLGAGSGALAREMIRFADRVDAVDPSAAMIEEGRRLPNGTDPKLHWIHAAAEDAPLTGPYGLATAGTSIHWLDAARVMPRLATALAPQGKLAIVEMDEGEHPMPALIDVFRRYSDAHHREATEIVSELVAAGQFVREGERRTGPVVVRRSIEEYLELLHSSSGYARVQLGDRAAAFENDVRDVFARAGADSIERSYVTVVTWGRPVAR